MAATRNHVKVAEFLLDLFPELLMTSNAMCDLPVETAIREKNDDVASYLVRKMNSKRQVMEEGLKGV